MLIPCELDVVSGSSEKSEHRRELNGKLKLQRARKHLMEIPENGQVGILEIRDCQGKHVVYPADSILEQCQDLFGPDKSGFEPHHVFIVIKKMSAINSNCDKELGFLFRIMQARLNLTGVRNTEEGHFIQLAIAFSRRISLEDVQLPPTVENKGFVVDLQSVVPGTWEMKVHFPNSGHIEPVRGNIAKLIRHVTYIDSAFSPRAMRVY